MSSVDAPRKLPRAIDELSLPLEGRIIENVKMNVPGRMSIPYAAQHNDLQDGQDLNGLFTTGEAAIAVVSQIVIRRLSAASV